MVRRADDADEEGIVRNGICPIKLAAVDLGPAIEPGNAGADSATCGRVGIKLGSARPYRVNNLAIARAAAEHAAERVGDFRFVGMRVPL